MGNFVGSSNYTFLFGTLPSGNFVNSSNYTFLFGTLPSGNFVNSSSYILEVEYNADVANNIEFDITADVTVLSPGTIIADADVTVEFDSTPIQIQPAVLADADVTLELGTQAQELSILGLNVDSTVEFSPSATGSAELIRIAANIIEFDGVSNVPAVLDVVAETIVEFDVEAIERIGTVDAGIMVHGALLHQRGTEGLQGGSAELSTLILLSELAQETPIGFVSSDETDVSQVYQIEGVGTTGLIETEIIQLNGRNLVQTLRSFVKINRIVKTSGIPLVGNVTIQNPHTTILGVMYNHRDSGAGFETTDLISIGSDIHSSPNETWTYYEKFFIRNSSLDPIVNFTLQETADPNNCIDFALDPVVNAFTTSINRTTRPGAIPPQNFTSLPKTLNNFLPGDSIGVWLRIKMPAGNAINPKTLIFKAIADDMELLLQIMSPQTSSRLTANVLSRRAAEPLGGGLPLRFMELRGAQFVEQSFFEPDPTTFRSQFYYNTRLNKLYQTTYP
ncbi:MAG: hypothetical protein ACYS8Y_10450 [Planctomycetota bacterium]|jgi:hypothetical protein